MLIIGSFAYFIDTYVYIMLCEIVKYGDRDFKIQ